MDHYNEQLVKKNADGSDIAVRALICAAAAAVIALSVIGAVMFRFTPIIIIGIGACYLAYLLLTGTSVEYEYIVTNNDLDIDKISGKRKRKRLITVKLNTVTEWGAYEEGKGSGAEATVMASDGTGNGLWYIMAKHEKYGDVMVIFNPTETTATNINCGVPHGLRKKDLILKEEASEDEQ